jgi:hypothetical protein
MPVIVVLRHLTKFHLIKPDKGVIFFYEKIYLTVYPIRRYYCFQRTATCYILLQGKNTKQVQAFLQR